MERLLQDGQSHGNANKAHHTGRCKARVEEDRRTQLKTVPALPPFARAASKDTGGSRGRRER